MICHCAMYNTDFCPKCRTRLQSLLATPIYPTRLYNLDTPYSLLPGITAGPKESLATEHYHCFYCGRVLTLESRHMGDALGRPTCMGCEGRASREGESTIVSGAGYVDFVPDLRKRVLEILADVERGMRNGREGYRYVEIMALLQTEEKELAERLIKEGEKRAAEIIEEESVEESDRRHVNFGHVLIPEEPSVTGAKLIEQEQRGEQEDALAMKAWANYTVSYTAQLYDSSPVSDASALQKISWDNLPALEKARWRQVVRAILQKPESGE